MQKNKKMFELLTFGMALCIMCKLLLASRLRLRILNRIISKKGLNICLLKKGQGTNRGILTWAMTGRFNWIPLSCVQ